MGLQLIIPDSIAQAMRLPEERLRQELLVELAVALYAQGSLAFGKAREVAGVDHYAFGQLLAQRGIPRQYGGEEFADDLRYARGE